MEEEANLPRKDTTTCSTDLIEYVQHMIREHGEDYKVRDGRSIESQTEGSVVSPLLLNLVTGHGKRWEELLSRHAQTNQEESGLVQALSRWGACHLPRLVTGSDLIMNQTLASRNGLQTDPTALRRRSLMQSCVYNVFYVGFFSLIIFRVILFYSIVCYHMIISVHKKLNFYWSHLAVFFFFFLMDSPANIPSFFSTKNSNGSIFPLNKKQTPLSCSLRCFSAHHSATECRVEFL